MKRWFVATLVLVSCRPVTRFDADVPGDVDRVALLTFDQDTLKSSSPLVPYDSNAGLSLERDDARTVLVGFAEADLGLDAKQLASPLTLTDTCDVALPEPLWSVEWLASGQLGPFTAPSLSSARRTDCAPLSEVRIEVGCLDRRCIPTIDRQEGCRIDLDLTSCSLGRPRVRVDDESNVCLEASGNAACAFTVHGPRQPFELDVARIVPHSVPPEPFIGGDLDTPWRLSHGWINDLAPVGDDVIVIADLDFESRTCGSTETLREIVSIDRNTMAVRTRTSTTGCIEAVAADPGAGHFLTTRLVDGTWIVSRHAPDLTVLAETEVTIPNAAALIGYGLVTFPNENRIAALMTAPRLDVDRSYLALVELDSLNVVDVVELTSRAYAIAAAPGGEVVLTHGENFLVSGRRAIDGAETRNEVVRPNPAVGRSLMGVRADERGVFTVGFDTIFHIDASETSRAVDYATGARPFVIADDPRTNDLLVFGTELSRTDEARELWALRYDPIERRFRPDVARIGDGVANRARQDDDGAVWLSLPWSAEVLRIR